MLVGPAHQFPTGSVLSAARRRALIDWSRRTGAIILEDDYDAEFRYDREPVRALQGLAPNRVLFLGTTSKTLGARAAPRLAGSPGSADPAAASDQGTPDDSSPTLDQRALVLLIRHGHYQRQIRRARALYRARRDQLVTHLARALPGLAVSGAAAGLHVALELPATADDRALRDAARQRGVLVHCFSQYTIRRPARPGLVIGYGRLHEDAIAPAVGALASVLTDAPIEPAPAASFLTRKDRSA